MAPPRLLEMTTTADATKAPGGTVPGADVPGSDAGTPEGQRQGPILNRVVFWVGIALSVAHIYFNTRGTLSTLWMSAWHFAGLGFMCALLYPMFHPRHAGTKRALLVADVAIGVAVAAAAVFLISQENAIYDRGVRLSLANWVAAIFLIVAAIDLTRRTTGLIIPILIVLAMTYVAWWGELIGGIFKFRGLSLETILFRSVYGDEAMFGVIARISATVVFMFILFGAFLIRSGAGDFIINLARALAGKMVGGPGLVAVFASGLTGTISGSAVGNTMSTGSITIPLMKRSGFPAKFAGGVEAAASTGGQLMPPIMGAGAFVMANFTQISYLKIVSVSLLPALLYFLSVGFFVRIQARRKGLQVAGDDAPRLGQVLRAGGPAFLLPIGVLIVLLIMGFTPTFAAGYGIIAVVVASWLTPNKMGPMAVLEALAMGARSMVPIGVLLIAIGLVVNVLVTTGVGNTLSQMIAQWSGGSLLIAMVLIALASLILGMGLPVTASYIVLASLSAPVLFELISQNHLAATIAAGSLPQEAQAIFLLVAPEQVGALSQPMALADAKALLALVPPDFQRTLLDQALDPALLATALISAHMIIFWLSQDSNVTPPVCLTAFAAAAIAKTPPMATGLQAWKSAKGLYIVPLLFAYTPLLGGNVPEMLEIAAFAALGLYALAGMLEGYLEAPVTVVERVVLAGAGAALLWPAGLVVHGAGVVVLAAVFFWSLRRGRRAA